MGGDLSGLCASKAFNTENTEDLGDLRVLYFWSHKAHGVDDSLGSA
jgi:hypothetical protein